MSSIWNNRISVSIFGESQDPTAGITISGLPAGEFIDAEEVSSFMARRYPSALRNSSQPCIQASPHIISGVLNERTTGAPLCALIQNAEIRHIEYPVEVPTDRVGTSDYTGTVRYRGYTDVMYLDKFTDRLTAPLCFAGAVCGQILERRGIYTGAHILQLHNIKDNPFDPVNISRDGVISVRSKDFPVIHDKKGWDMLADVEKARETGVVMADMLSELVERHPSIGEVRSIGLFGVIELVRDRKTKTPMAPYNGSSPEMAALRKYLLDHGVFVNTHWHTILVIPPLIITSEQLAEAMAVFDQALQITDAAVQE